MNLRLFLYISANGVGWFLYVTFLEHLGRQMRAAGGTDWEFGYSLYLMQTALPVLVSFLILNIIWGMLALKRVFPCQERGARMAWIGVVTAWVAVFLIMRYLP